MLCNEDRKADLSDEEVYRSAVLYHVEHLTVQQLAICYGVNQGRISEACMVMEYAVKHRKELYKLASAANGKSQQPALWEAHGEAQDE